MKRFLLILSFLAFGFSFANAQYDNGKVVVGVSTYGSGGGFGYVDTAASAGYVLTSSAGRTAPTWQLADPGSVLTSDDTTTSATLINTPLSISIAANEVRQFESVLYVNTDSATGMKVAITVPSGATIIAAVDGNTTAVTAFKTDRITATATASAALCTTAAGVGRILIHGTVRNGATAGNIVIQFETVTSGKVTIKANSTLKGTKI